MSMNKLRQFLGAILLAGGLVPLAVADAADPSGAHWLFVQDAATGSLAGEDPQHLTLTLKKVRKYITAFTDRPVRRAEAIPNQSFFDDWDSTFADDPPNATLNYRRPGDARPANLVLTLTSPAYHPDQQTVTYAAAVIHEKLGSQEPNAPDVPIKIPKRFSGASLFIDDATVSACTPPTAYKIGATGPGGGLIFFVDTNCTYPFDYMEAAPANLGSDYWWGCTNIYLGTSTEIGTGQTNTTAMLQTVCNTAAKPADTYVSPNGTSDWFLPSRDELYLMYTNLARKGLGSFGDASYWSSSEFDANLAWYQLFPYGNRIDDSKAIPLSVRPVRAF